MRNIGKDRIYQVYDHIIHWFDSHRTKDLSLEKFYLNFVRDHILVGGSVLDVGCGTGEPIAKFLPHHAQITALKLMLSHVKKNGLLIFTSGPNHSEEWVNNGGYELYHASLSASEYEEILLQHNFKVLIHKVKDADCGGATVWVAQMMENKDGKSRK